MSSKRYDERVIVDILSKVDRQLDHHHSITNICSQLGISRSSLYRWQQRYGLRPSTSQQVKESKQARILARELSASRQAEQALRIAAEGKLSCPVRRREIVRLVQARLGWSERHACRALQQNRSSQRYKSDAQRKEQLLRYELERLKNRHPAWGSRKVHIVLANQGTNIGKHSSDRIYRRLKLGHCPKRKPRQVDLEHAVIRAKSANDIWACDFTESVDTRGGRLYWLAVVDEHTRQCLTLTVMRTKSAKRATTELNSLILAQAAPQAIRTDNDQIWRSQWLSAWASQRSVEVNFIRHGAPWENGVVESFMSQLHRELLDVTRFHSCRDANGFATQWKDVYNTVRPHGAIAFMTPKEYDKTRRSNQ